MTKTLTTGKTIGIIGAGQLGKMLAQSAQKMGYRVAMYDPNENSCGFNVSHSHTVASFDDADALLNFVESVDVVTYEFENINGEILNQLADKSYMPQGTKLLLVSQERWGEKAWLNDLEIPTVKYAQIETYADLQENAQQIGFPAILKTNRLGYDGKGQIVIKSDLDMQTKRDEIEALLAKQPAILEAFCEFEFEVSVIVARDTFGMIKTFPISINQHINSILYSSLVGHSFSQPIRQRVEDYAKKIAKAGELIGVCGIEFFVTKSGQVLVNEIAPRPHNSGHYTIEACNVSQFDQHILAITGQPLQEIRLLEYGLMVNILGQHMPHLPSIKQAIPQAMYHVYDKGEAKQQRKMGHFTLTHASYYTLESFSESNQELLTWRKLF